MAKVRFMVSEGLYFALSNVASLTFTRIPSTSKDGFPCNSDRSGCQSIVYEYVPAVTAEGRIKLLVVELLKRIRLLVIRPGQSERAAGVPC